MLTKNVNKNVNKKLFRIKKDEKLSNRKRRKSEVQQELDNEFKIIQNWPESVKKQKIQKLLELKARRVALEKSETMKAPKYILE